MACDVQQDAAPENRSDRVDRQALESAGIGLGDFAAILELAMTREMTERVDMRAHVATESKSLGCRACARGGHIVAMLLDQAEQVRRMYGMMRHADEVRLCEVVELGGVQQSEEIGH